MAASLRERNFDPVESRLLLLPTSISLGVVGADFPFPRDAAPQSNGREHNYLQSVRSRQVQRAVAIARLAKQLSAVDAILE